jgi:hypothetical protein
MQKDANFFAVQLRVQVETNLQAGETEIRLNRRVVRVDEQCIRWRFASPYTLSAVVEFRFVIVVPQSGADGISARWDVQRVGAVGRDRDLESRTLPCTADQRRANRRLDRAQTIAKDAPESCLRTVQVWSGSSWQPM